MIALSQHTVKDALLREKLETACLVAEYYHAISNGKPWPNAAFPDLEEALRCNRLRSQSIVKINLSLKDGLKLVNSTLTEDQIVWTWQRVRERAAKHHA